jgi:hypothetical protein
MAPHRIYRAMAVPPATAYRDALMVVRMHDGQRRMLLAHGAAPELTLSAGALGAAAGHGWLYANRHYGALGRAVASELGIEVARYGSGTPLRTTALAEGRRTADGWTWRLYDEVAEAVDLLEW